MMTGAARPDLPSAVVFKCHCVMGFRGVPSSRTKPG
jgi:hypothetical protein